MSGRGRAHRAKHPQARPAESPARPEKPRPAPRGPADDAKDERKHHAKKEKNPKKVEKKEQKKPMEPGARQKKKCVKTKQAPRPEGPREDLRDDRKHDEEEEKPKNMEREHMGLGARGKEKCVKAKEPPLGNILSKTLDKLKIKMIDKSEASRIVNGIIKDIMDYLKRNTECFTEVTDLRTGSYYENVKISNPDEFDVMMTVPVARADVNPFDDSGAFYHVTLKRDKTPLDRFRLEDGILSASEMLKEFRENVKKCVKTLKNVTVERKVKGCPAVTLAIDLTGGRTISLDVVLALEVRSSWPRFTVGGLHIDDWLGKKVKQELKRKSYYLVPKYEGKGMVEHDGVQARDVWRVSFSHVEKALIMNHGSEKTCCEGKERCCRKDCLKLLKHLLGLLKEENPLFDKFCSYHAKTTLFHACCARPKDSDWEASQLRRCFLTLLGDFQQRLREGKLPNFFIPTQNLLSGLSTKSCTTLAERIQEELDNNLRIFISNEF
ncbi:cyclic GMP-AMP synthase [Polymixia lowei]